MEDTSGEGCEAELDDVEEEGEDKTVVDNEKEETDGNVWVYVIEGKVEEDEDAGGEV